MRFLHQCWSRHSTSFKYMQVYPWVMKENSWPLWRLWRQSNCSSRCFLHQLHLTGTLEKTILLWRIWLDVKLLCSAPDISTCLLVLDKCFLIECLMFYWFSGSSTTERYMGIYWWCHFTSWKPAKSFLNKHVRWRSTFFRSTHCDCKWM